MAAVRKPAPLRAVAADEKAEPEARLSITDAANQGNQRALLVAMRTRVAQTVDDPKCPPRDLASLTRRLQDINREIESLDAKLKQEAREDAHSADEAWDAEAL
jgi:hypothetical protein